MNLQNFGYLKTKKIINDIQKDTWIIDTDFKTKD
jgi:hypothetical protein